MAVVRKLRIETQNGLWTVEVMDRRGGYRCTLLGTTPKHAQVGEKAPSMSTMGRATTLGTDVEKLLAGARAHIEGIDGPIQGESIIKA